jgi:hypothetical protein
MMPLELFQKVRVIARLLNKQFPALGLDGLVHEMNKANQTPAMMHARIENFRNIWNANKHKLSIGEQAAAASTVDYSSIFNPDGTIKVSMDTFLSNADKLGAAANEIETPDADIDIGDGADIDIADDGDFISDLLDFFCLS